MEGKKWAKVLSTLTQSTYSGFIPKKIWLAVELEVLSIDVEFRFRNLQWKHLRQKQHKARACQRKALSTDIGAHACITLIAVIPWRTGRGCWGSQTPRSAGCQKTVSAWLLPVCCSESPSATQAVSVDRASQNLATKGLSQFTTRLWLVDFNIQSNVCRQCTGYYWIHREAISIRTNVKRMELNIA